MQMHNRDLDNKPFHQPRIKLETLDESYDDFEFPSYIPMEDYDDPDYMDVKPPKVDYFYEPQFSVKARVFFRRTDLFDSPPRHSAPTWASNFFSKFFLLPGFSHKLLLSKMKLEIKQKTPVYKPRFVSG